MKILIVHNILWAHYKAVVFQELYRLSQQRPDVEVLVLQIARNERSRAGLEKANSQAPTYQYPYRLLFDRFLEDTSLWERTRALVTQLWRYRPDVINLTGYYDPAQLILLLAAKAMGIRVIMQNESTAADHNRGGWKEQFKRFIFKACDGFFCFGTLSADYLLQLGVAKERILLRKNAVDNTTLFSVYQQALPQRAEQQQQAHLRPHNFIFVGRLIAEKNLTALLDAFAQGQKQVQQTTVATTFSEDDETNHPPVSDWGLLLLGDGPLKESLQQQINTLGLADIVQIFPGRPWFQVPEVLALADVLVLPSRSEPWGLVVNEAMACGLPVIVSDRCGCVADLVQHQKNGIIINPDQPLELVAALTQFMTAQADRTQMGEAAKVMIQPFAPEAVAQDMLTGFLNVCH